jgi:hypothetical protein
MKVGRIYKIITQESNDIYIGSTFQDLAQRFKRHKNHYKDWKKGVFCNIAVFELFEKYGVDKCKMMLIKEYEVFDRLELEAREQLWINKLKPINKINAFNIEWVYRKHYNSKNKEKIKEYYELNKDKIKERGKIYREKKKDEIKKREKEYRKNNIEKEKERRKTYREKNKDTIKEKAKIYRELNKNKIKEYYETRKDKIIKTVKEYREKNEDKIKEQKKQYRNQTVICHICSKSMKRPSLTRHIKTLH